MPSAGLKYAIGIDPGVVTGYSLWDGTTLIQVTSLFIHRAWDKVWALSHTGDIIVRFEDARQRVWFGESSQEKWQGAGSIKRDCQIWEDFLKDNKILYEMVPPKNNKTKLDARTFKMITGWKGVTNEHGRDSAMLVYGYNCKNKLILNKAT